MRVYEYQLVTSEQMDADITSNPLQIYQMFGASLECVVTSGSSPVGILYVQGSATGDSWANLTGQSQAVAANGTFIFDIVSSNVQFLRVFYDRTSGDGVLNVHAFGKGF